ncbi:MAG: GGDEF domain-containing protein [Betaproteobacteria bacterium]|nr:MAG: GGDEF domain-containing protein [Betaproteobacteria bacterium]
MAYRLPPALTPLIAPALVLLAAMLALAVGPTLPASLSGLKELGPYAVLLAAAGVAYGFNRARALVASVSLLLAYVGYRVALDFGPLGYPAHAVYVAIVVLVPGNVIASLVLAERGVRFHYNYRWLLAAFAEAALVVWIASAGHSAVAGSAWHGLLEHWLLRSPPTPWPGRVLFAGAVVAAVWRAWPREDTHAAPLEVGLAASLAAFFIACEWATHPGVFGAYTSAAGVIVIFAVLHESHRMAFRDELTGLPSRRALQEALAALGPDYSIAMVDVDHFKLFNDTHGHAVGDQVLKLVAVHLAGVQGGGRAFRYGGEEFTLVFPGAALPQVLPRLEALRSAIEQHAMVIRDEDRRAEVGQKAPRKGARPLEQVLSVTVSIGVAAPGRRAPTPAEVMQAADAALYRAKQAGRNRVER